MTEQQLSHARTATETMHDIERERQARINTAYAELETKVGAFQASEIWLAAARQYTGERKRIRAAQEKGA